MNSKKKVEDVDALIVLDNMEGGQMTSAIDNKGKKIEDTLACAKSEILALFVIEREEFLS